MTVEINERLRAGQGKPKPRRLIEVVNENRYKREIQFVAVNADVAHAAAGEFGELVARRVHLGRAGLQPGWLLHVSRLYNFVQVRDYLKNYAE